MADRMAALVDVVVLDRDAVAARAVVRAFGSHDDSGAGYADRPVVVDVDGIAADHGIAPAPAGVEDGVVPPLHVGAARARGTVGHAGDSVVAAARVVVEDVVVPDPGLARAVRVVNVIGPGVVEVVALDVVIARTVEKNPGRGRALDFAANHFDQRRGVGRDLVVLERVETGSRVGPELDAEHTAPASAAAEDRLAPPLSGDALEDLGLPVHGPEF